MAEMEVEEEDKPVDLESNVDDSVIDEATQQQYRIWKKNSPYLYDYLSTNSLLWPSLTVQFFPDIVTIQSEEVISLQRLLYGTFTLGQSIDSLSIVQIPTFENLNKHLKINKLDYNQEKQEFEVSTSSNNKLKLLQKINHKGDVNKARYMPQKPNVMASANNQGDLVIYERTKHSSLLRINDMEYSKVQIYLKSSENLTNCDIFAIDWNLQNEGIIASADTQGNINIYDIKNLNMKNNFLNQINYTKNSSGINDLQWFSNHDSIFVSVDEEGFLKIHDIRANKIVEQFKAGESEVNSLDINPGLSTCIATGDSNGFIDIWDIRNKNNCVHRIENQHTDSITQLKWNRKHHNILASSSTDTLVRLFDISNRNDQEGLIFIHRGHMLGVNDIDWSYHDDWLISSVGDDNSLQLWKPSHHIISNYN